MNGKKSCLVQPVTGCFCFDEGRLLSTFADAANIPIGSCALDQVRRYVLRHRRFPRRTDSCRKNPEVQPGTLKQGFLQKNFDNIFTCIVVCLFNLSIISSSSVFQSASGIVSFSLFAAC